MRLRILGLTLLTVVSLNTIRTARANRAALFPPGPVRIVAIEPGVIPAETSLVVRTNESVNTNRSFRDTIYDASLAEDVMDQNGSVLMPAGSPVNLGVFSFGYLGPGGGGLSELALGVRTIIVNGFSYPARTAGPQRSGGLSVPNRTAKWVGGVGESRWVLTRGKQINVPSGALLEFQIEDPIHLRGYHRQ